MHIDKVSTEKWDKFSTESRVFTQHSNCLKIMNYHFIMYCQITYPQNQILELKKKWFQAHNESITVNKIQDNYRSHALNVMWWVFGQMNLIFNKWYLFDFISMIRLWMHMIFEIGFSQTENLDRIYRIIDIDSSWLSLKSPAVKGYNVYFYGTQMIPHHLGGKEAQANNGLVKFINEH